MTKSAYKITYNDAGIAYCVAKSFSLAEKDFLEWYEDKYNSRNTPEIQSIEILVGDIIT